MWYILLSGPVAALVTCILCRRHVLLLWLGLACFVLMQVLGLARLLYPTESFATNLLTFVGIFFMLSSVVLLIGGAVRWGIARSRPTGDEMNSA